MLAIDAPRALLFSACAEGKVTTMDLAHGGQVTSKLAYAEGMDALAYDAKRGLLHAPSAIKGTMATIGVGTAGELTLLSEVTTAKGASCVAVDDGGGSVDLRSRPRSCAVGAQSGWNGRVSRAQFDPAGFAAARVCT